MERDQEVQEGCEIVATLLPYGKVQVGTLQPHYNTVVYSTNSDIRRKRLAYTT